MVQRSIIAAVACLAALTASAGSLLGLGRAPVVEVFVHGDSITYGTGASFTYLSYAYDLDRNLSLSNYVSPACSSVFVRGIAGQSWNYVWPSAPSTNTLIQDFPLSIVPNLSATRRNVLIAFAGTNGIQIAGHSAAQEYADFQVYITNALAYFQPRDIVIVTCLPRETMSETTRSAYNALLVGGVATYGYRIARVDLDPNIGCAGCQLNATYFFDTIHPTDAGHAVIANVIYSALTQ